MSEEKKIKVLTISDHPLSPSGVGTQTRYMIEHLLGTGKYQFISLGGAIKHRDYRLQKTDAWGDDWQIVPVDGYGSQEIVRSMLQVHKPDILWFMTDPRFYGWLWDMEDEIRANVPMVYHHVWDNYPYPTFNKPSYDSNDLIVTISKVTDDIVRNVSPNVWCEYLPHSVNMEVFKKLPDSDVETFRKRVFPNDKDRKLLFFWNSRNARRKQTGSLIWWFAQFLEKVGRDKARLLMHTDPKDRHGPDLEAIINELGLTDGEVMFSTNKLPPNELALMYNLADCTLCVSDAEGFGLSTTESLACETPIIVTMTGGLQEQVTDGEKWFGFGIEPTSKAVIGSQEVPFIYEDRINAESLISALEKMYNFSDAERAKLGKEGRGHLLKNYNPETLMNRWDEIFTEVHEKLGSWEERKGYDRWVCKEF
jgi:glycosyltransferase involved in cell wall biosynthesis